MLSTRSQRIFRKRRTSMIVVIGITMLFIQFYQASINNRMLHQSTGVLSEVTAETPLARELLKELAIKGRAPKTGYARSAFGDGWALVEACDMRNIMLDRYLLDVKKADDGCIVLSGVLQDSYTGEQISFIRGATTSNAIQIDHVVALSDAWQKGAQQLSYEQRVQFANDPLNLLPVDGAANQEKGDSDAASWLPPNKQFRCQYIARQIAVKHTYNLWTTEAEHATMRRILNGCGDQRVPVEVQNNP